MKPQPPTSIPRWKSTRIFRTSNAPTGYVTQLADIVIPFRDQFPGSRFWFTHYVDTIPSDLSQKTQADLRNQSGFLHQHPMDPAVEIHLSIRFRFESNQQTDSHIVNSISGNSMYLAEPLEPYNFEKGFSEKRFSTTETLQRAKLVSELFYQNCLLILDLIDTNTHTFETSGHNLNRFSGNPFQSITHILTNPYQTSTASPLPLHWIPGPGVFPLAQV